MLTVLGLIFLASPPPTPAPTPTPPPRPAQVRRAASAPSNSLAEIAARTRLRGGQGGLTITNENLKELAGTAELTMVTGKPGQPTDTPGAAPATREGGGEAAAQRFWQQRYQRARGYLRFLEEQEARLSREVERLKTEFYSLDDPFRRDGEVKPAWDEALEKLNETRARLAQARTLPDEVIQAALRAGALPGWFRGLPDPAPVSSPPDLSTPPPPSVPSRSREDY